MNGKHRFVITEIKSDGGFDSIISKMDAAKECGADGVLLVGDGDVSLSYEDCAELRDYCEEKGVSFSIASYDITLFESLKSLQDFWVLPSNVIKDYSYIRKVAETGKAVFINTDGLLEKEIWNCLEVLQSYYCGNVTLMTASGENGVKAKYGFDVGNI